MAPQSPIITSQALSNLRLSRPLSYLLSVNSKHEKTEHISFPCREGVTPSSGPLDKALSGLQQRPTFQSLRVVHSTVVYVEEIKVK